MAEQLQKLQERLDQQQTQIQQQQDQIRQLQQQLQQNNAQLEQQDQKLQNSVQQVGTRTAAAIQQTAGELHTTMAGLKTQTSAVSQSLQETQKSVKDLEHPATLHFKGIEFTPGGFITVDALVRARNENSDGATNLAAFPFGGIANSKLTEFRATTRASRLSLLSEGKVGGNKLSSYFEIDFMGAAPTANQVETNAWNPRLRQAWLQADMKNGLTFTAGQTWSLLTTNRRGIATRTEAVPLTIDASYVVGWDWVRQVAFRVTKNFQNKTWLAFEVANPETTTGGNNLPAPVFGLSNSSNALSPVALLLPFQAGSCTPPAGFPAGTVCNPAPATVANGISTNVAPDLLAKAAFEPGWGHYEIKVLGRFYRDRYMNENQTTFGGGLGFAAIMPVVGHNKADLIIQGLGGRGISRYGASVMGPDTTINPAGRLVPLRSFHLMGGLELHPKPRLDFFMYGGNEYLGQSAYRDATGKPVGWGSPLFVNTNCNQDFIPSGTCTGHNKDVLEGSAGMWYRFYRGNYGIFAYGLQYEYFHRTTWSGVGGAPKGINNVVLTSFRYFLP